MKRRFIIPEQIFQASRETLRSNRSRFVYSFLSSFLLFESLHPNCSANFALETINYHTYIYISRLAENIGREIDR